MSLASFQFWKLGEMQANRLTAALAESAIIRGIPLQEGAKSSDNNGG